MAHDWIDQSPGEFGQERSKEKKMLRSILVGLVAGQRGSAPLAAVATATHAGQLPINVPLQSLFKSRAITAAVTGLAAAEMAGDKMKSAP